MKTARIINGLFWAIQCAVICTLVCVEWHKNGCGLYSLLAGAGFFVILHAAFWYSIDETIREVERWRKGKV